jgi:hypothetical protein
VLPDLGRGLVDDLVVRASASLEREVEARELELEADRIGREDADGLFEQLLPGLVPSRMAIVRVPTAPSLVTGDLGRIVSTW